MVATTPTQLLRYPQVTDAPCDGDLHLGWFASDVEAKVTSHEDDLARTLAPPTLILVQSEPVIYHTALSPDQIKFDVVEQQSGGTFGLFDANQHEFRMPRTGYYQVGLHLNWPQNPSEFTLDLGQSFSFVQYDQASALFGGTGVETDVRTHIQARQFVSGDFASYSGLIRVTTTADYWAWEVLVEDFADDFTVTFARMYAIWTGDL
jgi:hypothetical protein